MTKANDQVRRNKKGIIISIVMAALLCTAMALTVIFLPRITANTRAMESSAKAAAVPTNNAEAPQAVCHEEGGKTCCMAKWAVNDTANYDISIKLPPGSHTMSMKIGPHGQEYCYWPDAVNIIPDAPPPVYTEDRLTNPVHDHRVISPYGIKRNDREHVGVDFYADSNEDVVAAMDGIASSRIVRNGLMLTIVGNGPSGIKAVSYFHLQSIFVAQGSKVAAGDKIAATLKLDKKRRGTGHLHIQTMDSDGKTIDPCSVMECQ